MDYRIINPPEFRRRRLRTKSPERRLPLGSAPLPSGSSGTKRPEGYYLFHITYFLFHINYL
jgi:hypothetical protein